MAESTCRQCGATIRYPAPTGATAFWLQMTQPAICAACTPAWEARCESERIEIERQEATQRRAERAEQWLSICPPLYRDTDARRLPEEAIHAVASWQYGSKGLGFCGPSGRGKTRAMMLLVQRMHVDLGRRSIYLTSSDFAHKVSRLASDKIDQLDDFLSSLCRASVLFIDDLGKGRMTDRVESELYHVIEQRSAHLRPILFTANATSGQLASLMSEDRGVPIVRRLAEFCQVVSL